MTSASKWWCVYIVRCEDDSLYTGITRNLQRRFSEHKTGGCRYTRRSRATKVLYTERHASRADAEKRENQIKRWSRAKKLALAENNLRSLRELSQSRD